MKKLIAKLLTLVLSTVVILNVFVACDWITTNTDRDMNQVVATVNIDSEKFNDEEIYKREIISGYLSYGYQYVQQGYYTLSQAYEMVLENLVSNKVIVQYARQELAASVNMTDGLKYTVNAANKGLENDYVVSLKNLLKAVSGSDYSYNAAVYYVRATMNDMIDSFVEEDGEADAEEDETYTVRTTPTVEEDEDMDEEELKTHAPDQDELDVAKALLNNEKDAEIDLITNVYDLNEFVYANFKADASSDKARLKAANEMLDFLEENGLNNANDKANYFTAQDPDKLFNTVYFESLLISRLESAIISEYEDSLVADIEAAELNNEALWEQYLVEYKNQEALYRDDNAAYEKALEGASDTSFVLYSPFGGYGYVSNLLIGFNEAESALLSDYSAKKGVTDADVKAYRANLLKSLKASDQRMTWVQSNYGTYEGGNYTFASKYRTSSYVALDNFIGTVTAKGDSYEKEDDNGVTKTYWNFETVQADEIPFTSFYNTYVKGVLGDLAIYEENNAATVKSVANYSDDTYQMFRDLLFAFSTDPGCLTTEYGYLYSPYTSATTYVEEFAAASKEVVAKGVGAYTVVATDFGYHIILCTKVVEEPYDIVNGKTNFLNDLEVKDTLAYNYKNVKKNAIVSTKITKLVETKITPFVDEESETYAVSYNKKAYKDLITEETSAQ